MHHPNQVLNINNNNYIVVATLGIIPNQVSPSIITSLNNQGVVDHRPNLWCTNSTIIISNNKKVNNNKNANNNKKVNNDKKLNNNKKVKAILKILKYVHIIDLIILLT
jgi:hypothetical protein